jgi:hypothetical protein
MRRSSLPSNRSALRGGRVTTRHSYHRTWLEGYERTLRDEVVAVRVMTLHRAADFVLREGGALWVNPGLPVPGRVRPIDHATASEDGLRQCLRSLGDLLTTLG